MINNFEFRSLCKALNEYLLSVYSRKDLINLFLNCGFAKLDRVKRNRSHIIKQFISTINWNNKSVIENTLFVLTEYVLNDLKHKCSNNISSGKEYREQFISLLSALKKDGADFDQNCKIIWNIQSKRHLNLHEKFIMTSNDKKRLILIDYLFITALTEEYQVVNSVLSLLAKRSKISDTDIIQYEYSISDNYVVKIGVASVAQKGASAMGVFVSPLLKILKPKKAVLLGIAATLSPKECRIGDVPCASQVISLEDIAVEREFEFRVEGFQTDISVRRDISNLQADFVRYPEWQNICIETIKKVVNVVNLNRRIKIILPKQIDKPHILVGNIAGGPFLLRDADFNRALTDSKISSVNLPVKLKNPVHSSLISAEMESHGFMRAALSEEVPASVLKGISDDGDENKRDIEKDTGGFFRAYACSNAVLAFLYSLNYNR